MKLSKFATLLEPLYTDTMTVKRHTATVNADGTTSTKLAANAIYTNVPCRISSTKPDNAHSTVDDKNPQYAEIKIFCSTAYVIHKGDVIAAVKKQDDGTTLATYTGTANLPLSYVTHREIALVDVGDA